MYEISAIVKDIRTGALPRTFIGYLLRRLAWVAIVVALGGTVIAALIK